MVQRYKIQCKIETFLEINRFSTSLRYKIAVTINSMTMMQNQTPPVPRGQRAKSRSTGDVTMTARVK